MLPFALRIAWFCLSLLGIIVCWVVLSLFSRAIDSYWGPMLYSIFATLLQGVFCLGMIYDMNPFHMPKAFCVVQTFVIYYSAWSLTGVCAAFTFATSSTVLWPSTKGPGSSTLGWKNMYCFPIFVFPLACLCASVPVLLDANAIQPTDDLHCDASHPEWARFLGYAGLSMMLTIPCLFLSAVVAYRIHQLHVDIRRSHHSFKHTSLRSQSHDGRNVPSEGVKSPVSLIDKMPDPEMLESPLPAGVADTSLWDVPDVPPSVAPSASQARWDVLGSIDEEDEFDPRRQMGSVMLSSTIPVVPPPRPNLAPAIWRLVLFQMAFFVIECLAALSTIIDVVRHRPKPTPFGTQHVALVLVGWGPAIVFGHLPAVRRQLMFWKR